MVITIDGTSGSGKSTISKAVSEKLSIDLLNTGLLYRKITDYCLKNRIDYKNEEAVICAMDNIDYSTITNENLHSEDISRNVPYYSRIPGVREKVRKYQKTFADGKTVIVEGRDIGSIVFPNAEYKLFITASLEERAKRRQKQINAKTTIEKVMKNLEQRDNQDTQRKTSPLIIPDDAIIIDTTGMSIIEVVNKVIAIISQSDA